MNDLEIKIGTIINFKTMKNAIIFSVSLTLLCTAYSGHCNKEPGEVKATQPAGSARGSVHVGCTPDLYDLVSRWAGEYAGLGNKERITVTPTITPLTVVRDKSEAGISFMSEEYLSKGDPGPVWKMLVGYEVIVPVISSKNPFAKTINGQGIRSADLARVFSESEKQGWGTLLRNGEKTPVHYYMMDDRYIRSCVTAFLACEPVAVDVINVKNAAEMIASIQKDPYGIGFCNLNDLLVPGDRKVAGGIRLMSIDKNGNGFLDPFENIYKDIGQFARGVWIGKYPAALCRNIYAVSHAKPSDPSVSALLRWVITAGQQSLNPAGYGDIAASSRQAGRMEMLSAGQALETRILDAGPFTGRFSGLDLFCIVLIALMPFLLAMMFLDAKKHNFTHRKVFSGAPPKTSPVFDEKSVFIPKGLYFDKTHMWAFMEKNGMVTIGIDDFLQHVTGPLTGATMKTPGEKVKKGDPVLSVIRNGKQLNIYAPVSGIIRAQNENLLSDSSVMNSSPYDEGWVYRIEPTNWLRETQFLSMAEKYAGWIKNEFSRLKDCLANSAKDNAVEYPQVILQDGGELHDGVLADLGPRAWEDFQTNFIDKSR